MVETSSSSYWLNCVSKVFVGRATSFTLEPRTSGELTISAVRETGCVAKDDKCAIVSATTKPATSKVPCCTMFPP
jgi:hypothetical protein